MNPKVPSRYKTERAGGRKDEQEEEERDSSYSKVTARGGGARRSGYWKPSGQGREQR